MSYKFLGWINMNESEYLVANAVGSATIGWPDFNELILDTLIKGMSDLSFIYYILLIIKAILAISSFYWIYKLIQNIDFTYRSHGEPVFINYLAKMFIVGVVVFLVGLILQKILFG